MDAGARERSARERAFVDGLRALVLRLRESTSTSTDTDTDALERALAELLETIRRPVDDPMDPPSPGESLSRADVYRIRISKFVARELPPGALAERARRREIRRSARDLTALLLDAPPEESAYLDRAREREQSGS